MKFLDRLIPPSVERGRQESVTYNGTTYAVASTIGGSAPDRADGTFTELVTKVHKQSGVIPAAVYARSVLMSQVRFRHADWSKPVTSVHDGSHGGQTRDLRALNAPGRTTLLMRLEQDVAYAGNAFVVRGVGGARYRLDPSRVTFVLGSDMAPAWDGDVSFMPPDATVVGIVYNPNEDRNEVRGRVAYLPGEFAHWMPEPDPAAPWRGESWVASLTAEAALESQIVDHQSKFFERGTVPSLVFLSEGLEDEELSAASERMNASYGGTSNAFKNLFLSNVTDVRDVSTDFSKIGFDGLHGSIEVAVAMRSRIPAAILGTRDSLSGSSLNAGNFSSARRLLADGWLTPHAWSLCDALSVLAPPRAGGDIVLSPDLSNVQFLQEDALDQAAILQSQMATIRSAVDSGFDPEDTVARVVAGDLSGLIHTGRASVQLQPMDANDDGVADSDDDVNDSDDDTLDGEEDDV